MGIQINGQTDTVTTTTAGGRVTVTPASFPSVSSLNVSGVSTFSGGVIVSAGTTAAPSISPSGDSNTGIFFPSADTVCIGEGGAEVIRVNSSGNVGINSTAPRSALDVGGELILGRQDSSQEGGQVSLCRSSDNASTWSIDAYGSTSTPSLRFVDNIAGAARMSVDGSGRVTMPYQPLFLAYGNTSQTLNTTATAVKIQYTGTEDIDVGNYFDAPNSNFNVPVTGKYLVYASIMLNSNFTDYTYLFMDFAKNDGRLGREIMVPRPSGGNFVSAQGSIIISAAVGDTIQVYLVQSGGTAAGVRNDYRHFYGYLIG